MTEKIITITSKNQITLPADYVRKLKLTKNRTLTARLKGNSLELRPQQPLGERMRKLWDNFKKTHPDFPDLSDEDMHKEASRAYAEYFKNKLEK